MKPEAKCINAPACFTWLPDAMRDLLAEAVTHGKDIEMLSEHRKEGEFELRIRLVPPGRRMMKLPAIRIGNAQVEIEVK
jgi:hypothetical protein